LNYAIKTLKARAKDVGPKYHADGTRSVVSKAFGESTLDGKNRRYWSKIEAKAGDKDAHFVVGAKCREQLSEAQALADRYGFTLIVVFLPRDRDLLKRIYADTPQTHEEVRPSWNRSGKSFLMLSI
jgi:hypothetical protein